jgi:DNA polymerase III delta prime subunit
MPAIRSRFQEVIFSTPSRDEILLRMSEILEAEKIEANIDVLEKIVEAGYPDIRQTVLLLEACSSTGTLVLGATEKIDDWKLELLPLLEASNLSAARNLVCTSATKEELPDVFRFLYRNLHRIKKLKNKEDEAVVLIAQYQAQTNWVGDGEIQIAALFIELGKL